MLATSVWSSNFPRGVRPSLWRRRTLSQSSAKPTTPKPRVANSAIQT